MISGFGLVTPLAHSAWEAFSALLAGRTIADRAAALPADVAPLDLVRALGCVSIAQHAGSDPAIELAERAAREAMFTAGINDPSELTGYLGTSKGAVKAMTHALETRNSKLETRNCLVAIALGPHAYLAQHLRDRLHLGNLTSTVAACASSLTALHQARLALLHADKDGPRKMLVVTSEAALLPAFIHSYERLGVLPPLNAASYRGRPLDKHRHGFMLCEVAAAVVLERRDPRDGPPQSKIKNQNSEIDLLDTAIAAEAYDLIRPAPGMPALAQVARKLLAGRRIDLIHPHATGTLEHDEAELAVYANLLSDLGFRASDFPQVYAHKGALGHGLGAAGLVSLVLACLCAKTNRRPPMPWLTSPIASPFLSPKPQAANAKLTTHALFAAGFGGHVAGAVIAAGSSSSA